MFLKKQLLNQGPGYNDFVKYSGLNFFKGTRILLSQIRYTTLNSPFYDPIEQIISVSNPFEYCSIHDVPIWLHHEARSVMEMSF
jgi:hypothetical protein